jgi:transposase
MRVVRGVATRHDKLLLRYAATVQVAAIDIWLHKYLRASWMAEGGRK